MRVSRLLAPLPALLLAAPLAASEPSATAMSFKTADGFTVKGTLTIPGDGQRRHPVVILAHQFHSDRSAWAPLAERLQARGIATLALDLRGHGESTDKGGSAVAVSDDFMASAKAVGFDQIPGDLAQAAAWVRKQHGIDPRRVGLAGASVGAFAALEASRQVRPLAVLALSPAGNGAFGDKAADTMKTDLLKSGSAALVFAAADDKDAADNAAALQGMAGVSVLKYEGKDHGFAFFKDHAETMAVFFGEYLNHVHTGKGAPAAAAAKPVDTGVVTDATLAAHEAAKAGSPAPNSPTPASDAPKN